MMATVPHVISGLGLRKFQADGFLLTRVYHIPIYYYYYYYYYCYYATVYVGEHGALPQVEQFFSYDYFYHFQF